MQDYEFSSKKFKTKKSVATVVDMVPSKAVEKAVAEEIKVADPVNADEILKAAAEEIKEKVVVKTEDVGNLSDVIPDLI